MYKRELEAAIVASIKDSQSSDDNKEHETPSKEQESVTNMKEKLESTSTDKENQPGLSSDDITKDEDQESATNKSPTESTKSGKQRLHLSITANVY